MLVLFHPFECIRPTPVCARGRAKLSYKVYKMGDSILSACFFDSSLLFPVRERRVNLPIVGKLLLLGKNGRELLF